MAKRRKFSDEFKREAVRLVSQSGVTKSQIGRELVPNVERVEIPDASHVMQEDNPPATNEAILGLRERSRGGCG